MTFDEVSRFYNSGESIKSTARHFKISETKCRKILITTGDYYSALSKEISELLSHGLTMQEIGCALGKSASAISSNTPYSKCEYNATNPSDNAKRIRECRRRKSLDNH
jgi:hypothetical protein